MIGPRVRVILGLIFLLCTPGARRCESAPSAAPGAQRRIVEVVKHVEENQGRTKTEAPQTSRMKSSAAEQKDSRNGIERGKKPVALVPTDPKMKVKLLQHMTGPLYFSPKCRKTVYRLYHHTRDCTIPAFFKRCARLLTRLAGSPQCTEG